MFDSHINKFQPLSVLSLEWKFLPCVKAREQRLDLEYFANSEGVIGGKDPSPLQC